MGAGARKPATGTQRQALVSYGQAPHSAVLGCADSRVPVDMVFDAVPGDVFVLRNAGNTCTHAEGSMVGSLEFAVSKLKSRLILVLGHTSCGAIAGAASTFMNSQGTKAPSSALEGLLMDLTTVAKKASEELAPGASLEELASHAVKVNVFHSMNFLIQHSRSMQSSGFELMSSLSEPVGNGSPIDAVLPYVPRRDAAFHGEDWGVGDPGAAGFERFSSPCTSKNVLHPPKKACST